jgi:hypothetical protein
MSIISIICNTFNLSPTTKKNKTWTFFWCDILTWAYGSACCDPTSVPPTPVPCDVIKRKETNLGRKHSKSRKETNAAPPSHAPARSLGRPHHASLHECSAPGKRRKVIQSPLQFQSSTAAPTPAPPPVLRLSCAQP